MSIGNVTAQSMITKRKLAVITSDYERALKEDEDEDEAENKKRKQEKNTQGVV